MQRSMKAAKYEPLPLGPHHRRADPSTPPRREAGTQRAFQSLPRHLRRRAASHNIRRLPTRLRSRARFEVSPIHLGERPADFGPRPGSERCCQTEEEDQEDAGHEEEAQRRRQEGYVPPPAA